MNELIIKLAGEILDLEDQANQSLANEGRMKRIQETWEQCRELGVDLAKMVVSFDSADEKNAFMEYMLQIKAYRERAEAAEARVAVLEVEAKASKKALTTSERKLKVRDEKLKQRDSEIKELKFNVKVYSDAENGRRSENGRSETEVMSFIDDCGHSVIVDCTGPAQNLKIHRQMLRAAKKQGCVGTSEHYDVDKLLESGTVEQIAECLYDGDICLGGRDGLSPGGVCTDWPDVDMRS